MTAKDLASLQEAEAVVAYRLIAEGVFRSVHMCPERPGSMIVLECESMEKAQEILGTLPMVAQGLIGFDLTRMLPYTGFSVLFQPEYLGQDMA